MGLAGGSNIGLILVVLGAGALLGFLVPSFLRRSRAKSWLAGGLVVALSTGVALYLLSLPGSGWHYMALDGLGKFLAAVCLSLGAVVALYSTRYMRESDGAGRYYGLLLLMSIGVIGVLSSRDTVGLYLYFELMSVSSYSLVSFRKEDKAPVEAGLKYVFLNATGSILAFLGVALSYVYTGSTSLGAVGWVLTSPRASVLGPGTLALALTVGGLGVKAAMVPFHTWLPDAYSYAPAGVSAMLSGIVTEMGFIAMLRLVLGEFSQASQTFGIVLLFMALITMTVGNLGALGQRDIKRMLSYSSIAQMGYMMAGMGMGLGLGVQDGIRGSLFHIMTHSAMKAGAFLAAGLMIDNLGTRDIRDMKGAGHKHPFLGAVLTISSLSLAGIPGFAGFMSKWWIYKAGFESGTDVGIFASVVAIGNSIMSLGYYLPLIFTLFQQAEPVPETSAGSVRISFSQTPWEIVPALMLGVGVMFLGLYPGPVLAALESATLATLSLLGGV